MMNIRMNNWNYNNRVNKVNRNNSNNVKKKWANYSWNYRK